jgi:AcrR family transcriptional regulator
MTATEPAHLSPQQPADDLRPSARVQHLLEIARQEFVRTGFAKASMDGIARAAGVSKETIYRHFADKEALFRAAVEALGSAFSKRSEQLLATQAEPETLLAQHAKAILDSAMDSGYLSAVWVTVSIAWTMPDFARILQQNYVARLEPLRQVLERIVARSGVARPTPIDCAADFGSLAVQGPRHLMGWPELGQAERERLAHRIATFYLYGGRARAGGLSSAPQPAEDPTPPRAERPAHVATLLRVATRHFLKQGFQDASLDLIGEQARVGRGTLYRHFGNKAGLFDAAMLDLAQDVSDVTPPLLAAGGDPSVVLPPYLAAASAVLASPRSIALHRTVISESKRAPALARQIYGTMRAPWTQPLAAWLAGEAARGVLPVDDPHWCAVQMLILATLGNRPFATHRSMDEAARKAAAERATAIFLHGFTAALA